MARLSDKNSLRPKLSLRTKPSRFLGSHLESPSPEKQDNSTSPLSGVHRQSSRFSTVFSFRHIKTSQSQSESSLVVTRSKHVPIDISGYQILDLPVIDYDITSNSPTSQRLPRHVPIIIPDFANPFAYELNSAISEKSLEALPSPATPRLRRQGRLICNKQARCAFASPTFSPKLPTIYTTANVGKVISMNSSQVSLATSEASTDGGQSISGGGNIGVIQNSIQHGVGTTNLSGLVCNVHRTTGTEPHALVGATTTILGDKLYVFGGRTHSRSRPQLTSDLYELDLIRRHWKKLDTLGDIPPPRYFHSVCPLGDSKLVCYGGMSPSSHHARNQSNGQSAKAAGDNQSDVVVMSDIHVYDIHTRTWTQILTSDDPQGRYAHCAAILPSSAVFTSATAPLTAIRHNPPSSDPHSGTLGVQLDGTGGAEMLVVGGQDSSNNYIEQISVFNLRSLKWTSTTSWDRKCGAYKSMVVPMTGLSAELIGRDVPLNDPQAQKMAQPGTPMLIYSNYNFLDVKLELQIRMPDGNLVERPMAGPVSPPGLRFPNGGIIDNHFVVSGTYLTSSKHEYALWALDLKSLTWGRIDTNGSVFAQGSWNRGVLWNRRNTFVILGHRKRSLVEDYNHRRINFSHVCLVELEAFGLYENPRKTSPTSGYVSVSAPQVPASIQHTLPSIDAGGRPFNNTAEQLGQAALSINELCDMDLVALGGERIPCNSYILSKRWGPHFNQLLLESASMHEAVNLSDAATLRPSMHSQASRNSIITITPSVANGIVPSNISNSIEPVHDPQRSLSRSTTRTLTDLSNMTPLAAMARPRALYLPHMVQTIELLLHFLYTSSLPPVGAPLCTPHTLCSLLQMARPYQVDGLLEATVERLHEVLDGRNAAAVFNAAAMAAGGGGGFGGNTGGTLEALARRESEATSIGEQSAIQALAARTGLLHIDTNGNNNRGHAKTESMGSASTATSASTSTDMSHTDNESTTGASMGEGRRDRESREIWTGDKSAVIGLQKRGLRGLMEGRRLRERANTLESNG